jgi:Pectate lyase superfamily protein
MVSQVSFKKACRVVTLGAICLISGETLGAVASPVTPQMFGAKADGASDDSVAMQKWIDAMSKGSEGELPAGNYRFSIPLVAKFSEGSIKGAGPYRTVLTYGGRDSTSDILAIGDGKNQYRNWFLSGFRVTSTTKMTGGAALRLKMLGRSMLRDIIADGQDGNGNLWIGIWFDAIDVVSLNGFESRAQNDAIRVNGTKGPGPKADLFVLQGKIAESGVGIHIGGGFGGINVDQTDIIHNQINVLIDTAIVHEGNREVFFGLTSMNDSASQGDGVLVDDDLAGSATLVLGGWIASASQNCVHVRAWHGSVLSISAPEIFNCRKDGIYVEDPTTRIDIGAATQVRANRGWGINSSAPTRNVHIAVSPFNNALGPFSGTIIRDSSVVPSK